MVPLVASFSHSNASLSPRLDVNASADGLAGIATYCPARYRRSIETNRPATPVPSVDGPSERTAGMTLAPIQDRLVVLISVGLGGD